MRRLITTILALLVMAIGSQAQASLLTGWELNLSSNGLGGPDIKNIGDINSGGISMNGNINLTQAGSGPGGTVALGDAFSIAISHTFTGTSSYTDGAGNPQSNDALKNLTLVTPTLNGTVTQVFGVNSFAFEFANPGSLIDLFYGSTLLATLDLIPDLSTGTVQPKLGSTGTFEVNDQIGGLLDVLVPNVFFDSAGNDLDGSTYAVEFGNLGSGVNLSNVTFPSTGGFTTTNSQVNGNFTIAAVPEPTTMLLLGSGILGLPFLRRRSKRS